MNFMDGHILSMIVLSLLLGGIVFIIRMKIKKGVIRA
jgi:hypothetical protein